MRSIASSPARKNLNALPPESVIFGSGSAMASVREKLEKVADINAPILIEGESGTGKDIIARYIHQRSSWAGGALVKVNCPAIPDTLVESELFGYERGAFTGAVNSKPGRIEAAQYGTLFLDEISELALGLQSKLLQLLQDGRFCPIGATGDKHVELRVVCATNRQLHSEVEGGRFRQDLFYRINVFSVHLPPLRERKADLPALTEYLLEQHALQYGVPKRTFSPAVMALLQSYDWPGNIRQLENLTKRFAVFGTEDVVLNDLHGRGLTQSFDPQVPTQGKISLKKVLRQATKDLESRIILNILQANEWNRKRAARAMSISYRALLYKMKEMGIHSGHEPLCHAVETAARQTGDA